MSRYTEGDDDYEYVQLEQGRWQNNARRALKSKRGRKALAEIREALLALPEPRLIEGALCTVGGPERIPQVTDAEIDADIAGLKAGNRWNDLYHSRERMAELLRDERDDARRAIRENIGFRDQGCGVCVNGALLWHRLVKQGLTEDEAFAALPALAGEDGDPLSETARIAEKDAGIAYTLAWELAFRNDETYRLMTPEERWSAFLAWINNELGDSLTAGTVPATETSN